MCGAAYPAANPTSGREERIHTSRLSSNTSATGGNRPCAGDRTPKVRPAPLRSAAPAGEVLGAQRHTGLLSNSVADLRQPGAPRASAVGEHQACGRRGRRRCRPYHISVSDRVAIALRRVICDREGTVACCFEHVGYLAAGGPVAPAAPMVTCVSLERAAGKREGIARIVARRWHYG